MLKSSIILLSLTTIAMMQPMSPTQAAEPSKTSPAIHVDQLRPTVVMGKLGQPLGKVITISGKVVSGDRSAKSNHPDDLALQVLQVNDQALATPVTLPWTVFTTAAIKPPKLHQAFKYVGYETGSFTGVPHEAFKVLSAVASREFHFESRFEVLQEDLRIVQNRADLMRSPQQRVRLVGQYVVTRRKPDPMSTGIPGFKGDYLTVQIVLQDGTAIALNSPLIKQSLRSAEEVKQYEGQLVEVTGRLESLPSPRKEQRSLTFIVPESIRLSFQQ
ncbi:MAG: hypothetical protein HC934_09360 [Acaryochloridaceae cyanobacterium SU_2_1]|nr:hypothetical protein [Acaryochloridaceae cyanobacterium SU_2_1]NJN39162.1 hypothetical protein [Acaryochloridaceae cyanobacterium CSU_3_4]